MVLVLIDKFHIFTIIDHEIVSIATVVLILSQVQTNTLLPLENKLCNFLDKVSFGIYVYHPLVLMLMAFVFIKLGFTLSGITALLYFIIVVFLSIMISHLSYLYIETPFLKLKDQFAVVKSTNTSSLVTLKESKEFVIIKKTKEAV